MKSLCTLCNRPQSLLKTKHICTNNIALTIYANRLLRLRVQCVNSGRTLRCMSLDFAAA